VLLCPNKNSTKIHPKVIKVVLLSERTFGVPCGRKRKLLINQGQIQLIYITCIMSALQIKNCIIRTFSNLPLNSYEVLKVISADDHTLVEVSNTQELNGKEIIGITGFGSLYLAETCVNHDQVQVAIAIYLVQLH